MFFFKVTSLTFAISVALITFLSFFPAAVSAEPTGTGGYEFPLGSDAGDDLAVDGTKLVVEGDLGNVGIGTSTPTATLEVVGTIKASSWASSGMNIMDLTDVASATVTAGRMFIADGTDWESVAVSGDIAVSGAGAMTVTADTIQLSDLSDVNTVTASGGKILIADGTDFESVTLTGDVTVAASGVTTVVADQIQLSDLSDVNTVTASAGRILLSDGVDFESTAVFGDATLSSSGQINISDNAVQERMLKAVDVAGDEECLTYETTTGDFEWQTCGSVANLIDLGDVNTATATGGRILVADGTDFESVAMTGDCSLNAIGGITCSGGGGWTDAGTRVYTTTSTDNVGIGTSEPSARLDVSGAARLNNIMIGSGGNSQIRSGGGGTPFALINMQNEVSESFETTSKLATTADPVFFMDALPSGATERLWQLRKSGTTLITVDNAGNVGIAMSTPQALLQVGSGGTLNNVGSGDVYIQNDMEVDGQIYPGLVGLSDVASATVTAGRMLVADGTDWESVAVSGDIAVSGAGAMTVTADTIQLSDLSDVNTVTATGGRILVGDGTDFESVAMTGDCSLNAIGGITCSAGASGWTDSGTNVYITTSTDHVGIGVTGTNSLLHVGVGSSSANSTTPQMIISNPTDAYLSFRESTGGNEGFIGFSNGESQMNIGTLSSSDIFFYTTDTRQMAIKSSGNVGIGTSAPTSTLHLAGSLALPQSTKTGNYTATASDAVILVNNTSGGQATITLPAASGASGRVYIIKRLDASANNTVIDGNAAETIDGAATRSLTAQYESVSIVCDGSNWHIL